MMTRDEALGNEYSREGLRKALLNGYLYDYVAQWYPQMSKEELKELVLNVYYVAIPNDFGSEYEESFNEQIEQELKGRDFFED